MYFQHGMVLVNAVDVIMFLWLTTRGEKGTLGHKYYNVDFKLQRRHLMPSPLRKLNKNRVSLHFAENPWAP